MAARVRHDTAECPVARSMDLLGDRWSLLIVRDAFDGIHRFSDLQRSLGLARNILTARLRELVANEILEVVPAADGSSYHEYVLTDRGRDLFTVVVALRQWGEKHLFEPGEAHSELVDTRSGRRLKAMHATDSSGRRATGRNTYVRKVIQG